MILFFLCLTSKKPKRDIHLKTRRCSDALWWAEMESGEGTGSLLSSSHQHAPVSARQEREATNWVHWKLAWIVRNPQPNQIAKESSMSIQDINKTALPSQKAEFLPQPWSPWKTQNHLARVGTNESPGTTSVTRGHSPYLPARILQALVASGAALTDMVCLSSGFPYADAYYVICLGYLHSLWGPFWSSAKHGTANTCIVI